jgi:hypothetical protein
MNQMTSELAITVAPGFVLPAVIADQGDRAAGHIIIDARSWSRSDWLGRHPSMIRNA